MVAVRASVDEGVKELDDTAIVAVEFFCFLKGVSGRVGVEGVRLCSIVLKSLTIQDLLHALPLSIGSQLHHRRPPGSEEHFFVFSRQHMCCT